MQNVFCPLNVQKLQQSPIMVQVRAQICKALQVSLMTRIFQNSGIITTMVL